MFPNSSAVHQRRPARLTAAAVILVAVSALALLYVGLQVVSFAGSADDGGTASRLTFLEFVVDAPEQTVAPVALAIVAGAAAFGVVRGRRWGRTLALGVGAVFLVGAAVLVLSALQEWGLPGSFSALLIPPAVVACLIGGYLSWAALTSGASLAQRQPPDGGA